MTNSLRLLAVVSVLILLAACWILFREGPAAEEAQRSHAAPSGMGPRESGVATAPGALPRMDVADPGATNGDREVVTIRGTVVHRDTSVAPAGIVDLGYADVDARGERHALAQIEQDRSFRLALPRGMILRRATVRPARSGGDWRKSFLETETALDDKNPLTAERELTLHVDCGFTIAGIVVDAATDQPIASAQLSVRQGEGHAPVESSAKGEFTLRFVPSTVDAEPLAVDVLATHPDHVEREIDVREPERSSAVTGVRIALERGVRLRGRVIDPSGAGVGFVALQAMQATGEHSALGRCIGPHVRTQTRDDGTFELPAMPRLDQVEVRAHSRSHAPAHITGLDLRREAPSLLIRVVPSVPFVVIANYPDGTRVAPDHSQLVFTDANGEPQVATAQGLDGWQFSGAIGYPHDFSVCATGPRGEQDKVYHVTGTALTPGPLPPGKSTIDVTVTLEARGPEDRAPSDDSVPLLLGVGASAAWGCTWQIQLVDSETHRPIDRTPLSFSEVLSRSGFYSSATTNASTSESGSVRLTLGGGLRQIELRVPGYLPVVLETSGLHRGRAEATLALRRRR